MHLGAGLEYLDKVSDMAGHAKALPVHGMLPEKHSARGSEEGQGWRNILADRNRAAHAYNEETAETILGNFRLKHHA